jgi:hypothetical protein
MKSLAKQKSFTLRLTRDAREKRRGDESLGDLLNGAIETLREGGFRFVSARWLARQATRALCEQIILAKQISLPVEVNFTGIDSTVPGFVLDEEERWLA